MSNGKQVFLVIPRRLMITLAAVAMLLFLLIGVSFQWAAYVDGRSNQRLCNLVVLFDNAYSNPKTELQQKAAAAFRQLREEYRCK